MKNLLTLVFSMLIVVAGLAGCATPSATQQAGSTGMSGSNADMQSMCTKHKQMMGSMSPAEQNR